MTNQEIKKTDQIIHQWLEARQALVVQFYRLCEMKPKTHTSLTEEKLTNFCQDLIDYVSCGHFEVFEKIALSGFTKTFDNQLFVKILNSTNKALDFSDKYTSSKDYTNLCAELSSLGLSLTYRFDLEDEFIDIYQKVVNNNTLTSVA